MTPARAPEHPARRGRTAALAVGVAAGVAALLAGCTTASAPAAEAVEVYAAASLADAFTELESVFEDAHPGVDVRLVFDGSGTLAAQIVEGAAADVFAAADERTMAEVVDAGLAVDPRIFAANEIRLLTPEGNPAGIASLADLARPEVVTVVCAPEVPCGAASTEVLDLAGIDLVPASEEQNVSAVVAKLLAGEADAGLAYASDAHAHPELGVITPPEAAEVRNRYPITALTGSGDAARDFVDVVLGAEGQRILADHGFLAP